MSEQLKLSYAKHSDIENLNCGKSRTLLPVSVEKFHVFPIIRRINRSKETDFFYIDSFAMKSLAIKYGWTMYILQNRLLHVVSSLGFNI